MLRAKIIEIGSSLLKLFTIKLVTFSETSCICETAKGGELTSTSRNNSQKYTTIAVRQVVGYSLICDLCVASY